MKKGVIFISSIILSLLAGVIGSIATIPNIPTWYAALVKPPLLPPNEVFGPIWTLLYVLIGIALALVIIENSEQKKPAYLWFTVQLILNTTWSLVFFGLQQPWPAVLVIVALLFSVVMTLLSFNKIVPTTKWLLLPYGAWICFASYLNMAVAILN